jgi:Protein of unknown function (DUF1552)
LLRVAAMHRFDRRNFLLGTGGAWLAIPLLESLLPRSASAQTMVAPKRLIVMSHHHGRVIGNGLTANGAVQDAWSPRTTTGALPVGMSPELAPLEAIRNEVVTVDRVDNVVRHLGAGNSAADGHYFPSRTFTTCVLPKGDGSGGGPSIDFVAGQRLRANGAMPASIVVNANSGNCALTESFWGVNGTPPNAINLCGGPEKAIEALFTGVTTSMPPPTPTLRDRLVARRASILDDTVQDYTALRARVSARDQARLDQHLQFLRDAQARAATSGMPTRGQGCQPLTATAVPPAVNEYSYSSAHDDLAVPVVVESIVQAIACDVSRSFVFEFMSDVPTFDWLFPSGSPFVGTNWHAQIHGTPQLSDAPRADLQRTFHFYAQMFTLLVQRLAAITDVDGQRLLDNTLVLWVSDLGYGATHATFNQPVVFAGLKSAFSKGQGRHVVPSGRATLGDVYAHTLRLLGGTDQTFGVTGTLASAAGSRAQSCGAGAFCTEYGFPGYITPDTPLHTGPLDL